MSDKVNMWLTLDEKERPVIGFEHIENSSAIHDKVLGAFIKRAMGSGVRITKKSGTAGINGMGGCLSSSRYHIEWDE